MFICVEERLSDPAVRRILSYCLFDSSPEGIDKALSRYKGEQFFAWEENGELLGVCGFRVLQESLEICHIAVDEKARGCGYGGAMITALREKYNIDMQVETDDDAVGFYRKCGFETAAIYKKYGDISVRRWNCSLRMNQSPETNEERRARIYPVILSEYNPEWPDWFTEEKANLERLIGLDNIAGIHHYGSTSVPGLTAKPTVDILLEIKETTDIEKLIAAMPDDVYICLRQQTMDSPDCVMFIKGYLNDGFAEKVFHIHVRYPNDWDELYFRDYLIAHPETAAEYATLKRELFQNHEHDRDGYTEAKGEFIRVVTAKAKEEYGHGV